jgi:hypothetical protein
VRERERERDRERERERETIKDLLLGNDLITARVSVWVRERVRDKASEIRVRVRVRVYLVLTGDPSNCLMTTESF